MIPKKEFDLVYGGSTVVEGSALMRVTGLGEDSTLGKIIRIVQDAQVSKPGIQELADEFAKYFVPAVMIISIATFVVWITVAGTDTIPSEWVSKGGGPFLLAFSFGLAVWVSACPCAFGLATPTAVLVATGVAAKYGVLIRRGAAIQTASEVDTICFDKTGTLTRGCTEVTDFIYLDSKGDPIVFPTYDHLDNINDDGSDENVSSIRDSEKNTPVLEQKQKQESDIFQFFHSYLFPSGPEQQESIKLFYDFYSILQYLFMTEVRSSHPLAKGITNYCKKMIGIVESPIFWKDLQQFYDSEFAKSFPRDDELLFNVIPGEGVHMYTNPELRVSKSVAVLVGNSKLLLSHGITLPKVIQDISKGFTSSGKVAIYYALNGQLKGILSVSDKVRPETTYVLRELMHHRGINCFMVTGDSLPTALAIGSSIGLPKENILAGVKPEEKELFVAALQEKGAKVAFIGDGTNDSPALSRSHVGMTMAASGSDVAIEAGDILLYKNHLSTILISLDLSSKTLRRIKLNYLWAFGYNICLIPVAAGLFYPFFGFALQPMYAGAVMAISSVSIVVSSLSLALFSPHANLERSEDRRRKQGEQKHEETQVSDELCQCPISNIAIYEEETNSSLLTNGRKKVQGMVGRLSYQLISLEKHREKSKTAYEILQEYKQSHSIGDIERGEYPGIIVDLVSIGDEGNQSCGCGSKNCKCAAPCSCGLRRRNQTSVKDHVSTD